MYVYMIFSGIQHNRLSVHVRVYW